ncbi:MAG TPA: methyl-accepting chemotaxis protein [Lachnospiraceae bacterium]|nr:methyl-accepting chemotaxis protein [Lachnospiraceae bacterium]
MTDINNEEQNHGKIGKEKRVREKRVKEKIIKQIAQLKVRITYVGEKTLPMRSQIRFKLVVSFLVPVVFIVFLGVFSYQSAKSVIVKSYETSAEQAINSSSMYFELLMQDMVMKASQFANNDKFVYYYVQFNSNSVIDNNTYYNDAKTTLHTLVGSSVGIYGAHAFGVNGKPMTSLTTATKENLYSKFNSSDESEVLSSSTTSIWVGYHKVIDEGVDSKSEFYAASFIRKFAKGEGYIAFDLLNTKVNDVLKDSVISSKSIVGFITGDGRETLAAKNEKTLKKLTSDDKPVFYGTAFYEKAIKNSKKSSSQYVKMDGESYLFVYSKIGDTGAIVSTLIPKNDILNQLIGLGITTVVFVIIACIIAILIGLILATDISKTIHKFSDSFKQIAEGNMKAQLKVDSQDEFSILAHNVKNMQSEICSLISDMSEFSHQVSDAATDVSSASNQILHSMQEVANTVDEMERGVNIQVEDTEKSYSQMTNFAQHISEACVSTEAVGSVANETQTIVNGGQEIVNELKIQTTATAEITSVIIRDIEELEKKTQNIGTIIDTIKGITTQTNLLSLNASIEAARAGDSGRGFAVVAQEIRKLATESGSAVENIRELVESIQEQTQVTVASANRAEKMIKGQTQALINTVDVFHNVDHHIEELVMKIDLILQNMQIIAVSKDDVLDSIKNIATVSEQTAGSSRVVGSKVNSQMGDVEILADRAQELIDKVSDLEKAINKFTI